MPITFFLVYAFHQNSNHYELLGAAPHTQSDVFEFPFYIYLFLFGCSLFDRTKFLMIYEVISKSEGAQITKNIRPGADGYFYISEIREKTSFSQNTAKTRFQSYLRNTRYFLEITKNIP